MPKLFGTSGVRGPAATLFTPTFSFDLGRSFGLLLDQLHQHGQIAIAIDNRTSSPHIANYLIQGLRYQGFEIVHLGALPTPALHYAHISAGFAGALMVTGSHIDLDSNGVKFFALKEEITKEHETQIETLYSQIAGQVSPPPLTSLPPQSTIGFDNYLELLLSLADSPLPKLKIVFDPGNGGQTETICHLLRQLGQEVIAINNSIQEPLISRDTESDGSFAILAETVVQEKADLGVGFDSDGDRAVFVDHLGRALPGDLSGSLLASWFGGDQIVCPINVSQVVDHLHKEVVRTPVGSPFVIAAMKKYGSNFGFESNGGCIHEDVMLSRDGGTTLVRMLNLLKWSGRTLAQHLDSFPKFYLYKTKFDCPKEKYPVLYQKLQNFMSPLKVDRTDGLKLYLDDQTWILFRGSGNAPEFRVFVESLDEPKSKQLIEEAVRFCKTLVHV